MGSLKFPQFDEADAGDGFNFAQGFDGGVGGGGSGDIDLDDGERLPLGDTLRVDADGVGGAAECEVGDVEAVFAEDGAYAADDAGYVVIANGDEGAVERGLDVDAVVAQEAWRCSMEDGS